MDTKMTYDYACHLMKLWKQKLDQEDIECSSDEDTLGLLMSLPDVGSPNSEEKSDDEKTVILSRGSENEGCSPKRKADKRCTIQYPEEDQIPHKKRCREKSKFSSDSRSTQERWALAARQKTTAKEALSFEQEKVELTLKAEHGLSPESKTSDPGIAVAQTLAMMHSAFKHPGFSSHSSKRSLLSSRHSVSSSLRASSKRSKSRYAPPERSTSEDATSKFSTSGNACSKHPSSKNNASKHSSPGDANSKHSSSGDANSKHSSSGHANSKHSSSGDANPKHSSTGNTNSKHPSSKDNTSKHSSSEDAASKHFDSKDDSSKHSDSKDDSSKHSDSKDDSSKHSDSKDDFSKHSSSRDTSSKHSSSRDTSSKHSSSRDTSSKHFSSRDASSKHFSSRDASSKHSSSRDASSKRSSSGDASSKHSGSRDDSSKRSRSRDASSKHSSSGDAASMRFSSGDAVLKDSISQDATSKRFSSGIASSKHSGSKDTSRKHSTSRDGSLKHSSSTDTTSEQSSTKGVTTFSSSKESTSEQPCSGRSTSIDSVTRESAKDSSSKDTMTKHSSSDGPTSEHSSPDTSSESTLRGESKLKDNTNCIVPDDAYSSFYRVDSKSSAFKPYPRSRRCLRVKLTRLLIPTGSTLRSSPEPILRELAPYEVNQSASKQEKTDTDTLEPKILPSAPIADNFAGPTAPEVSAHRVLMPTIETKSSPARTVSTINAPTSDVKPRTKLAREESSMGAPTRDADRMSVYNLCPRSRKCLPKLVIPTESTYSSSQVAILKKLTPDEIEQSVSKHENTDHGTLDLNILPSEPVTENLPSVTVPEVSADGVLTQTVRTTISPARNVNPINTPDVNPLAELAREESSMSAPAREADRISTAAQETAPTSAPTQDTAPTSAPAQDTAPTSAPAQDTAPKSAPAQDTAPKSAPAHDTAPTSTPAQDTAPTRTPAQEARSRSAVVRAAYFKNAIVRATCLTKAKKINTASDVKTMKTVARDARGVCKPDVRPVDALGVCPLTLLKAAIRSAPAGRPRAPNTKNAGFHLTGKETTEENQRLPEIPRLAKPAEVNNHIGNFLHDSVLKGLYAPNEHKSNDPVPKKKPFKMQTQKAFPPDEDKKMELSLDDISEESKPSTSEEVGVNAQGVASAVSVVRPAKQPEKVGVLPIIKPVLKASSNKVFQVPVLAPPKPIKNQFQPNPNNLSQRINISGFPEAGGDRTCEAVQRPQNTVYPVAQQRDFRPPSSKPGTQQRSKAVKGQQSRGNRRQRRRSQCNINQNRHWDGNHTQPTGNFDNRNLPAQYWNKKAVNTERSTSPNILPISPNVGLPRERFERVDERERITHPYTLYGIENASWEWERPQYPLFDDYPREPREWREQVRNKFFRNEPLSVPNLLHENRPNLPEMLRCKRCLVSKIEVVLFPCAHAALCLSCSDGLPRCSEGLPCCPFCHSRVEASYRIFLPTR